MSPDSNRRRFLAAVGGGAALALTGCTERSTGGEATDTVPSTTESPEPDSPLASWDGYDPDWTAPTDSPLGGIGYERVVEDLRVPWDFDFAANGELFVSERVGRVLRIVDDEREVVAAPKDVVRATAIDAGDEGGWWSTGGEGGLLGVAVHPAYPDEPYVYAYYTYPKEGVPNGRRNRVARFDVESGGPGDGEEVIVDDIPANQFHNGGRLAFGPLGNLWVTNGDGGLPDESADPASLAGKVLRVTPEGEPAPENPELEDGDPRVFSVGHRNPQAITWLPDGTPVVTEHGPNAKDEVNLLSPGDDYGWPNARTEEGYAGTDYHRPVVNTGNETWAPSGAVFYTGEGVPALRNRLLVGALRGTHVNVLTLSPPEGEKPPLDGGSARRFEGWYDDRFVATSHKLFEGELGRVRYVGQGPDGEVYAITSNRDGRNDDPDFPRPFDDVLVRLTGE